jgi:periplasmic divalent cation tolerance protein
VTDVPDDLCEISITSPDAGWLADLVRELITMHLCASAHIVAPIRSIYQWDGGIEDTSEARAFVRSRTHHVDAIVRIVRARHPYRVPSVAVVPIIGGDPAYLDWMSECIRLGLPS